MRYVEDYPHAVREVEHALIPLDDGARLAARLWLPEGAEREPVPAILEYIPYRKRDLTRARDDANHRYFAGHGYACVRVDLRGSGDSDGVLSDEYLPQELEDGVEVLRWIAAQPWCDGRVGVIGISWGGFNGLQLAALRPPELAAIITVCSTDDRYADDVHYMGGCLLGDNLSWAHTMFARNALPPDPHLRDDWRERWLERLEGSGLWLEHWLAHQRRDAYWRHGSICEDVSRVEVPVLAVSGWADGYSNAVFRLLSSLDVPRQGLIGPWGHRYPHQGVPGPAIGFLQHCLRWWDRWLKGRETGIEAEPMLRVWMQDSIPPTHNYVMHPGRWVAEPSWPAPGVEDHRLPLGRHRLGRPGQVLDAADLSIQSPLSVGLFAGKWCSFSATPDLPHDQREEDGGALVFESDPLDGPLELLGMPTVRIELSSSHPVAMLAARLSDVAPDGKATRVTYGLLNLTHRESHADPAPLEPGRRYQVALRLNGIAQRFPAGHRLRLSLSTSYWPIAWPAPESARLTIHTADSRLCLPVRPPRAGDGVLSEFEAPEAAPPTSRTLLVPRDYAWTVVRDLARDVSTLRVVKDEGAVRIDPIDLEVRRRTVEEYSYRGDEYGSIRGEVRGEETLRREGWEVSVSTRHVLTSDPDRFHIQADLDAWEGDRRVFSRSWDRSIPRDLL